MEFLKTFEVPKRKSTQIDRRARNAVHDIVIAACAACAIIIVPRTAFRLSNRVPSLQKKKGKITLTKA